MGNRDYWLDRFTGVDWEEFLAAGGKTIGFPESRRAAAEEIKPGDYLVCYHSGVSRFVGVLEVMSPSFKYSSPISRDEELTCRFKVKPVVMLTPETAVPVLQLRNRVSIFRDMKSAIAWTGQFRGSPARWNVSDGEAVLEELVEARNNPTRRPM